VLPGRDALASDRRGDLVAVVNLEGAPEPIQDYSHEAPYLVEIRRLTCGRQRVKAVLGELLRTYVRPHDAFSRRLLD